MSNNIVTTVRTRCVKCNQLLRKGSGHKKIINTELESVKLSKILNQVVTVGDVLCSKCRLIQYRHKENVHQNLPELDNSSVEPPFISMPLVEVASVDEEASTSMVEVEDAATSIVEVEDAATSIVEAGDASTSTASISMVEASSASACLNNASLVSLESSMLDTSSSALSLGAATSANTSLFELSSSSSIRMSTSEDNPLSSTTDDSSFTCNLNSPGESSVDFIEVPFNRVISTHKYCFIATCRKTQNIITVPAEARKHAFLMRKLYIPKENRCCPSHLIKKRFYRQVIMDFRIYSNTSTVDSKELKTYFGYLSSPSNINDTVGDFTLSEERLRVFTGLTWENVIVLREMMTSMKNSKQRNVTQALVVFLFKLRTGNSNELIAATLGLEREQQVSDFCHSVMNCFLKDILPLHLGVRAFSREHLIQNETSNVAKKLYNIDTELALIFDGTYIRHQKSSNNAYQRKSYSGQKKVPLCKPFTVCTTNGYIVDMFGPFYANQNDAQIMQIVLDDPTGLKTIMERGDLCIVDRGFRDVVSHLEESGFRVLMPALKGKRPQLTTEESNSSRKVTKVRWVVEAIHGILGKKYQLLHHQLDNKLLPTVKSYFRIACFLNNKFGKRLNSDVTLFDDVTNRILSEDKSINSLAQQVAAQHWNRRKTPFKAISSREILDFPEMTEKDLKILFTGSYQLSQAISYLAEIMDEHDNHINVRYLIENNNIVKFELKSRHISRKTYKCYIDYIPNSTGYSGIKRYCCECANGNRTIGCCSHVAAIIYYLSYARYDIDIVRPAEILTKIFDTDQITPIINEDSDED